MAKGLSANAKGAARVIRTENTTKASRVVRRPEAIGRLWVRHTCRSNLWSAMSLMTQPALRIRKEPMMKTSIKDHGGKPSAATKRDHNAGSSSSKVPYCFGSRIRSLRAVSFCINWEFIARMLSQNRQKNDFLSYFNGYDLSRHPCVSKKT